MKKILSLALAMMLTVLLLPVNVEAAEAKKVALNKNSLTIYVGGKTTLKNTGTAKKVKWSSTKPGVASVSQKGVITAKKAGKTTITAKAGKKVAKCTVTVKKQLKAKQIIKKANQQFKNAKSFSINGYINSIKKKNFYMAMGVNLKTNVVFMDLSPLGFPKMYIDGNKTYWQDTTTKTWYYYTSDSDETDFVDSDDLEEGLDDDAKYKLLSNKNFNGKKCAVLRITEEGETIDLYFNLANYELIGASQGSGKEKVVMTIDTKTAVKVPAKALKTATYKELSFEE
ncbi:MAG: Ig-like domain-containing protein [Lachnospiraceae bacterium]|nr:Ig-like domain-containing protein [Lachnospiraceae bacterium]